MLRGGGGEYQIASWECWRQSFNSTASSAALQTPSITLAGERKSKKTRMLLSCCFREARNKKNKKRKNILGGREDENQVFWILSDLLQLWQETIKCGRKSLENENSCSFHCFSSSGAFFFFRLKTYRIFCCSCNTTFLAFSPFVVKTILSRGKAIFLRFSQFNFYSLRLSSQMRWSRHK